MATEALHSFRFLLLAARRFFSHLISLVIDSHCFPFVGPNDEDLGGVAQKRFLKTLM
jgi:hypothetical protein